MTTSGESVQPTSLVIGGFGALGSAIAERLASDGFRVLRASRAPRGESDAIVLDPSDYGSLPILDVVCWAQGANVNDSATNFTDDNLAGLFAANVATIASQLRDLLAAGRIRDGASLVVISSIWEQIARPGKFSYTITKAAVGGLVRAAATDLADRGIRVNAVLPGVVDTPMTRAMLSPDQIAGVEDATGYRRMVTAADVADAVASLARGSNGISGQSLLVDLGFTIGRTI
ncbi:SDR family NAD(P)-dependent oxidoreductase [Propionicimonas sp.]|uniref:SDR family NAD(P)-dependent oxidoreductase n=1 Tax=Propionicimonas sp. TaxID=1955623 RepID=UPI0017AE9D00|nr:SDR family oxidoreductase [Propionicimonas sp.]MBU3975692.1 SDR family oxidoreductase [Actinomycetota bacterium]MBA3019905.1 SDR family oxidoreductase [Propionicimonas sp.]MBU3986159.1 SDR family oxidoreductase [Actinomycetota bacterium]MBU4007728.1 SDR family oxidoreductase [Actinomycetota bacterium]MBU4063986.1 SDR family oxidoreductase [Actinomycetota bacterium]